MLHISVRLNNGRLFTEKIVQDGLDETLDGGVRTCDSIFCPIVLLDIACSSSWNDHGRDSLCSLLAQVKQCLFFLWGECLAGLNLKYISIWPYQKCISCNLQQWITWRKENGEDLELLDSLQHGPIARLATRYSTDSATHVEVAKTRLKILGIHWWHLISDTASIGPIFDLCTEFNKKNLNNTQVIQVQS